MAVVGTVVVVVVWVVAGLGGLAVRAGAGAPVCPVTLCPSPMGAVTVGVVGVGGLWPPALRMTVWAFL